MEKNESLKSIFCFVNSIKEVLFLSKTPFIQDF